MRSRRSSHLLRRASANLLLILICILTTRSSFAQGAQFAYVADAFSNAISEYRIDAATGALTLQSVFPTVEPLSIVVTPSERFAFATNYVSNGSISGFSIDPTTGSLSPVAGSPFPAGDHPYRLTVAPSGRFVYAANVGSNNVSAFSINASTGMLTPVPGSPFAVGIGPYKVAVSPNEQFAYVANSESTSASVSAFSINPNTGALTPVPGSPFAMPGNGASPQAVAVSPSGKFLYVGIVISDTVGVYSIDASTGALTAVAGSPFKSPPGPWDFAFSPSGQYVYVANAGTPAARLDGSISVYSADTTTGALVPVAGSPFASGPATHSVALNGGFAYATSYYTNKVAAFGVNATTGVLTPIAGSPFATGSNPVEIAFAAGTSCATANGSAVSVSSVYPASGGNAGAVTVSMRGCGITGTPTVKLTGIGPDILASNATVMGDSTVTATFDLTGALSGLRTLAITNADGSSASLEAAFTVEEGGTPSVSVDIIGFDKIRIGREQTYYVSFANVGNVDAKVVPIWIRGIPKGATRRLNVPLNTPPVDPAVPPIDWSQIPIGVDNMAQTETEVPLLVPVIPAGFRGVLPISITVPTGQDFVLQAAANECFFRSPLSAAWSSCANAYLSYVVNVLTGLPGGACAVSLVQYFGSTAYNIYQLSSQAPNGVFAPGSGAYSMVGFMIGAFGNGASLAGSCASVLAPLPWASILGAVLNGVQAAVSFQNFVAQCGLALTFTALQAQLVHRVAALDPNDKAGSEGIGPHRYVPGAAPLPYIVQFANEEAATASAQDVSIIDQLDPTRDDLKTVSLGPINFRDRSISPPPFQTTFATTVDLRPVQNLLVAVNAQLSKSTGLLTWNFKSLDPATGLPPTDPAAGFLPPGGEGGVFFTVMPKQGLPTDTQIQNQATIVFDANSPIATPTWTNTLDNTPPTSHVLALPATETSTSFTVQWTGTDLGSGIQDFTIYVSDNGGPFAALLSNTATTTSARFTGQTGHSYAFYSIARDLVGNLEGAKTLAEATTQVLVGDTTPPVIIPNVSGTLGNSGWYTSNVTISWHVSDPESGIASSSGCNSTTLTADTAGVTLTCTATNGAGLTSSVPITIKIDRTPPTVTVGASASTLWPPNGKLVPDTISGVVADGLSGIDPSALTFTVVDKYGLVQLTGAISLGSGGQYSVTVMLEASRLGQDLGGRQYQIIVSARDKAGNPTSASTMVTVPHDQEK
jgi:6-phosphogluconolactonase (cycloisomerase 2 family)